MIPAMFDWFPFTIGCIMLVDALLVGLFAGEKYLKWYCHTQDPREYDLRKFKIVHISTLVIFGLCAIWVAFREKTEYLIIGIMFAALIASYVLIHTVCKKKDAE